MASLTYDKDKPSLIIQDFGNQDYPGSPYKEFIAHDFDIKFTSKLTTIYLDSWEKIFKGLVIYLEIIGQKNIDEALKWTEVADEICNKKFTEQQTRNCQDFIDRFNQLVMSTVTATIMQSTQAFLLEKMQNQFPKNGVILQSSAVNDKPDIEEYLNNFCYTNNLANANAISQKDPQEEAIDFRATPKF